MIEYDRFIEEQNEFLIQRLIPKQDESNSNSNSNQSTPELKTPDPKIISLNLDKTEKTELTKQVLHRDCE